MKIKRLIEASIENNTRVKKIKYSAGGLILRKGDGGVNEILLIQRSEKDFWRLVWEFPRGGCEEGKDKSLRDCMVREVKEETGLDVKSLRFIDKTKYIRQVEGGRIITFCYNYVCKMLEPDQEVRLSKEHQAYKWISEVGEVELMATPEQKKTIQRVLNDERSIVSYPRHQKVEENLDFYLGSIQKEDVFSGILAGTPAGVAGVTAKAGLLAMAPSLLKVYFAALLIKMAVDAYKNNFSKAAKACKGYAAEEKRICMLRAQITGKKAGLTKLQTNIDKCSKDKNPEGCRIKVSQKIQKMQQEVGYLMQRETELRGKAA